MEEQVKTKNTKMLDDLRELTEKALKHISEDMNDQQIMLKNAKHYRDIALMLEKLSNVVGKISELDHELNDDAPKNKPSGYVDNSTPREKREILEATVNYYDGQKERIAESLEYLKQLEAEEGEDLDIFDPKNPCDRRPPSLWNQRTSSDL